MLVTNEIKNIIFVDCGMNLYIHSQTLAYQCKKVVLDS